MSLETQIANLVAATNQLTGEVSGKMTQIDQRVEQKRGELDAWKNTVVEVINGVPVAKLGGIYTFERKLFIDSGGYPTCNLGPTYVQLLEFENLAYAAGGSSFEVNVHIAHRGMGYASYYEYVELRGTYWGDGAGGIARKFSNGNNKISLFCSDATTGDQVLALPGTGTPVAFAIKNIGNDGNNKKYALMLEVQPSCGSEESLCVVARYTDPHAKPAANFASLAKPAYPNL